jgi:uncharacterized membrane protein YphA (DoxX/SURF4 family)
MKSKILFVVSLLMGLLMINGGLSKFFHYMPEGEMSEGAMNLMAAFGESQWLIPLLGMVEIIGGILIILPKTRALGAIVLFPVIIGILLFHSIQEPSGFPIALILLLVDGWIILENKGKYTPMIS